MKLINNFKMSTRCTQNTVSDFGTVSEITGIRVTAEALSMMYTRYGYASELARARDVLEVACGSGQGLGVLAASARSVIGGDYSDSLVRRAQAHYKGRVPVVRLDGHALPFRNASFDLIILFEAIYYLRQPELFLDEAWRVLRPDGKLLICSANKEWAGFSPSPFSQRYFSARELAALIAARGFQVEMFGAFPETGASVLRQTVRQVRSLAVHLNLIPKTMRGKEALKRIFYGRLVEIGSELEHGIARPAKLYPIVRSEASSAYRVLYALGRKQQMTSVPS